MSQFESFLESYSGGNFPPTDATGFSHDERQVGNNTMSTFNSNSNNVHNINPNTNTNNYNNNSNNMNMNIKREEIDEFLNSSVDIKRQLSQSFGGGSGGPAHHGGVSKPQSRRSSVYIKSQEGSDAEDNEGTEEDKEQGNERKRRDNINDKIQELLTLIPSEYFATPATTTNSATGKDESLMKKEASPSAASPTDDDVNNTVAKTGTKDGKPNKGQILTKSVEYLQNLQNLIDENNRKEVELIMKLETLKLKKRNNGKVQDGVPIRIGYTSAERALGEIGVGPCSDEYFKSVLVKSANSNKSGRKNSI